MQSCHVNFYPSFQRMLPLVVFVLTHNSEKLSRYVTLQQQKLSTICYLYSLNKVLRLKVVTVSLFRLMRSFNFDVSSYLKSC